MVLFGLVVVLVALYSVAAYCPRRQAAWAGIATGAVLAWPLWRDGGGPGGLQSLGRSAWRGDQPGFPGACVAVRRLRQ